MPASGLRSHGARVHPPPHQGRRTLARRSAASGLVLATQRLGGITGRGISGTSPRGRDLRDGHLDPRRPQVHRLPAPERVRPAHPPGTAGRAPPEAGHTDDGRPADLVLDGDPIPRALEIHAGRSDGLLRHARLRGDRLRRRLVQGASPPVAGAQRPLEAPAPRRDHGRRGLVGTRHRSLDRRLRAHPRLAHHPHGVRLLPPALHRHRWSGERREPDGRDRRARGRRGDDRPDHVRGDERRHVDPLRPRHRPARRVRARPGDPRGRSYGRRDRVPLVQRVPRRGDHGRHGLDGPRGRDRRFRSDDENRAAAAPDRRDLRRRGGFGDPPGRLVPLLGPAHLPDGADPPPLRDESVVRDQDHGPLLDPRRHHVRSGLRLVLPLLPRLPRPEMSWLVLGLARSGQAAALALRRRGEEVIGIDASPGLDVGRLAESGVEIHLGTEEERLLDGVETLIKSPGVPGEASLVQAARARGTPVWSEVELGSRLLATTVVAVTGTNGKTTTSELLGAMLRAPVAGNVGRALTELDGSVRPGEVVVCEVSSFQLEDIHEFKPHVAVLLNLEPDHLDRHGSFEAYADAKLRIFENQDADDVAVVPRRFEQIPGRAQRLEFAPTDELPAEPLIPGAHNRENAAAAARAARALGVDDARISEALETFPGVAHRLEPVADANGVLYVNDSKATNTAAARRAVAAYDQPLHVILGGRGKGESYTELALDLAGRARRAYLIGEAARAMDVALELAGVDHELSGDLETAVRSASKNARPGEIVLIAPACASYDQFHDFEERGE